jgi:cytidylate kinase
VVFPDAHLKIFLVADLETRAQRRLRERQAEGVGADLASERAALRARDEYDAGRATAPLKQAEGAIVVDTTRLTVDGQVQRVVELFAERTGA